MSKNNAKGREEPEHFNCDDYHNHEYSLYGICEICGDIKYQFHAWYDIYGGEPDESRFA